MVCCSSALRNSSTEMAALVSTRVSLGKGNICFLSLCITPLAPMGLLGSAPAPELTQNRGGLCWALWLWRGHWIWWQPLLLSLPCPGHDPPITPPTICPVPHPPHPPYTKKSPCHPVGIFTVQGCRKLFSSNYTLICLFCLSDRLD